MLAKLRTAHVRARWARALFAVAGFVALAGLLTYTVVLLVAPSSDAAGEYHVLRRGDDYVVFTQPVTASDDNVHGEWRAAPNQPVPERMLVIHGSEVARLVAGEYPQGRVLSTNDTRQIWGGFASPWNGWVDVTIVERGPNGFYVWPWEACAACSDPRPTIVWIRGDGWKGASMAEFETGDWSTGEGAPSPILFEGVVTEHNFDKWVPLLQDATSTMISLSAAFAAWWGVEGRLARQAVARASAVPGTDDLLRLVDESRRYLVLLHRQYLLGGLVLVVALVTLAVAGLPPLVAAARAHFVDPYYAYVLLGIGIPFLGGLGAIGWIAGYSRLRHERERWARLSPGLDDATARLMEP